MDSQPTGAGSTGVDPAGADPASADPAAAQPASPELTTAGPARADWPGPVGRPAAAHWWSIQPPPPADPISAPRAYAEVLVVFATFFGANIIVGGEALFGRALPPIGSWAVFVPDAVSVLAKCVLAVLVVVLLSARRGISPRALGFGWARKADGTPGAAQNLRIAAWVIVALVIGGLVTVNLADGRHILEPLSRDYSYLVYSLAASVNAGILEEIVVLAFVVATLRQARRPLPEIVVVAVLLRCSYHDYYGWGVAGIAVWASIFIWLYLRSGSILPMIIVHVLWDASQFLGQWWLVALQAWGVLLGTVLLAAVITWLVNAASRGRRTPALQASGVSSWPPPSGGGPWPPPPYGTGAWPPPSGFPSPPPSGDPPGGDPSAPPPPG